MAVRQTLVERLWGNIDTAGDGCWPWTSPSTDRRGYGLISVAGRLRRVSRVVWELAHGEPPPDDVDVAHHCDNPPCARPSHLFLATRAENLDDMVRKGRSLKGELSPRSKLTEAQVREVRRAYFAGENTDQQEIAARLGVSRATIRRIIRGDRWTHVN